MQDPTKTPNPIPTPNTDPNVDPNADPNADGLPQVSLDQVHQILGEQLGGNPVENEAFAEATEVEKAILEEQYAAKIERSFDRMKEQIKNKKPDATDNQIHNLSIAIMQGDVEGSIEAVENIVRQEKEMDDRNEEQKNLHVEGGAGGNTTESGRGEGLASVFKNMANSYSSKTI